MANAILRHQVRGLWNHNLTTTPPLLKCPQQILETQHRPKPLCCSNRKLHPGKWQQNPPTGNVAVRQGSSFRAVFHKPFLIKQPGSRSDEIGDVPTTSKQDSFKTGSKPQVIFGEVNKSFCRVIDPDGKDTKNNTQIETGTKFPHLWQPISSSDNIFQVCFDLNDLQNNADLAPDLEVKVQLGELVVRGSHVEKYMTEISGRLHTCSWYSVQYTCALPKGIDLSSLEATCHSDMILCVHGTLEKQRKLPTMLRYPASWLFRRIQLMKSDTDTSGEMEGHSSGKGNRTYER